MDKFKIGDNVKTPDGIGTVYSVVKTSGGIGTVYSVGKETVDVEMHYTYLVEYKLEDCEKIGVE